MSPMSLTVQMVLIGLASLTGIIMTLIGFLALEKRTSLNAQNRKG